MSAEEPALAVVKLQEALDAQRRAFPKGWDSVVNGLWAGVKEGKTKSKKSKKSKKGQRSVAVWASLTEAAILACTLFNDRLLEESGAAADNGTETIQAQRSFEEEWSNKEGFHALGLVLGNQHVSSKIKRILQEWVQGLEGKQALPLGGLVTFGAFWEQEQTIIKALRTKVCH